MLPAECGLVHDESARVTANEAGSNYWPLYAREVLRRIGMPYHLLAPHELCTEALARLSILVMPPLPEWTLDSEQVASIHAWVRAGGLLVGFATRGLDRLFGVEIEGTIDHRGDEFTPSVCISLCDDEWTAALLDSYERATALPVIAPAFEVTAPDCRELARLLTFFERDTGRPAITYRNVGDGAALWWAFDLGECLWKMQQGRPVYEDFDGDGKLRTMDQITTRPWDGSVPYADLMTFALRRVLAEHGAVFVHQLPPMPDGTIPDAVIHWGGDDEAASDVQVPAAEFMAELGLPYHINIMPDADGVFGLSPEDFDRLKEIGCERSIHFNFITGVEHPYAFTQADLKRQLDAYLDTFGEMPICTVFHWVSWTGWAEPARWLAELGLMGDNNRIHWRYPPVNPVNRVAYAFGTAFPFHYYDDAAHGNERIDFVCLPITGYEVGHWRGELEPAQLRRAIEHAARWQLTTSIFIHPVRLTEQAPRDAVREALAHIDRLGLRALHMGTDELCVWWHERDRSTIDHVQRDGETLSIRVDACSPRGCIVQMLAPDGELDVLVNGAPAKALIRDQAGTRWLFVAVPTGHSEILVSIA